MRAGQRVAKYVLDERIAVGGMAEVWAGRVEGPQGFTKPVALKFILESFAGDPELERLFVNEARIAAQLQHANLVTVFDFDKAGADQEPGLAGRYYIAMERVEGQDVRRLAEAAKRAGYLFPVGVALHLAGEVLKALRYVHERRDHGRPLDLIHRDVSPHNVLVSYAGEVKLSDFGIAKTRAHSGRTKTGTVRGKLAYASPEQLGGEPVDHRTDQFALGVTLWEILAGRRLFDGRDDLETIANVVRCAVPPLGAETSGGHAVPAAVDAVVRRMLSPRREDRFRTTGEALSSLLALPSYLADGTALGDLMRTLFLPAALEMPETMAIAAFPGAARDAPTRTMQKAERKPPAPVSATPPTAREAPEPASQPPTRRQAPGPRRARLAARPAAAAAAARRRPPRRLVVGGGLAIAAALATSAWLLVPSRTASTPIVTGPGLDPGAATAGAVSAGSAGELVPTAAVAREPEVPGPDRGARASLSHGGPQQAPDPAARAASPAPSAPVTAGSAPGTARPVLGSAAPSPDAGTEAVPRARANKSPILE